MISNLTPDFSETPFKRIHEGFYENFKKSSPVVSILTPFYNTGKAFLETYKCICNQSIQNFEWIIVNDNSSDELSLNILNNLAKNDDRIKVIHHKENKGPAASRNTAIANARYEFVFFIDSDDLIESTYLEKCILFLSINREYSFVASYLVAFEQQQYIWNKGFCEGSKYLQENFGTSNFCARRKMFEKVKYDETITISEGGEDWDFWLKCAEAGFWGYCIPEHLQWYRIKKKRAWDFLDPNNYSKLTSTITKKYGHLAEKFPNPKFSRFFLWEDKDNQKVTKSLARIDNVIKNHNRKTALFIIPWMECGGADKFNLDLLEGLSKKGWKITIVTTVKANNDWISEFAKFTPDIFNLSNICDPSYYLELISYLITSRSADIIYTSNSELGYYCLPFIKSKFPKVPIVDYLHSVPLDWRNGGYPRLSKVFSESINCHIVSSKQLKKWCITEEIKDDKIETCYINVDTNLVKPKEQVRNSLRKKHLIDDDTCVIIFVARLSKEKQPYVLLKTCKILKDLRAKFKLWVIGDGPEKAMMTSFIDQNGLNDCVSMLGYKDNHEVINYYSAADIFFLPSEYEGISLALYESMSCACLPIVSNVGGQKELVGDDCGFLIERSNPENEILQYVNVMYPLIQNEKKRKIMGAACRNRIVEHFDIKKMQAKMEGIFLSLIKDPKYNLNKESSFLNINQMYFTLLQDLKFLYEDHVGIQNYTARLENHNQRLLEEIGNTNPALATRLMEHEKPGYDSNELYYYKELSQNISNWYNNEYEVLPLWYKRVGHIIKVFKGKRTLKSLFVDEKDRLN